MAVALEKFVQQLEDSGILDGDTLKDFLPPKREPKDAIELARELVRQKKLTKFQAEEVSKGQGKSLVLGNYVLMEKIGAGGMGQVFKAQHRVMERYVAVKLLPAAMTKDKDAIARFHREVKAAAKLRHPNIVSADDADQANGVHFLVMELVEGSDLSALVKKNGPYSIEDAVSYILQAAKGLEFAHKKGVVHRDVKPANLLLDLEGTVKILDMGLARIDKNDGAPQADLTNTGTIMGTVDYMSPEQALDTKTADARADIYALGCSLFYLLTGTPTYQGDTLMKKLVAHREQPIPSLRTARPDASEQLAAVFKKMVAKKLEDRYQTMTEVIAALDRCCAVQSMTQTFKRPADTHLDTSSTLNSVQLASAEATILSTPSVMPPVSVAANAGTNRKLALTGAAVLGVAMLAVIVVSLRTRDGTLIVEVDQLDTTVEVVDADGKVEVSQKGSTGTISISVDPGKHRLKVTKEGFTVFGQDFEIAGGGKQPITAKLVPLEVQPAVDGTKPAAVAGTKKSRFFETPAFNLWFKDVADLPAEQQVEAVSKKLVELNPGFDGKVKHSVENGVVVLASFSSNGIADLSPLRGLTGLAFLDCPCSPSATAKLTDLSPLKGLPLQTLGIQGTDVSDLSPLRGMKLTHFYGGGTKVVDLSPLKDMPLVLLSMTKSRITDFSPMKGMKLRDVDCVLTKVNDLSPFQGMPLTSLLIAYTQVVDLLPLTGMPLTTLECQGTPITDIAPLRGMPLKVLHCDFKPERDSELLRSIKSLEKINGKPAAEFWKEVDEQQQAKTLGFQMPGFEQWVKDVAAMSAEEQIKAVSKKLVELNPGFDGQLLGPFLRGEPVVKDGKVIEVEFRSDAITDLSPMRAFASLKVFGCLGSGKGPNKLADLTPLRGIPLTKLTLANSGVSDLSPLKGMTLVYLYLGNTQVTNLTPLEAMPLKALICNNSPVSDVAVLFSCKSLEQIDARNTNVTAAGVTALQTALPNCKIEWDDPTKKTTPEPAASLDPDRRAAEWVLSHGGTVKIVEQGKAAAMIGHRSPLPTAAFRVQSIQFTNVGKPIQDDDLSFLDGLTELRELDLTHLKGYTDAGLKSLSRLTNLTKLSLFDNNQVTDLGMQHLSGLKKLEGIHIAATMVTEKGLKEFVGFPLHSLSVGGRWAADKMLPVIIEFQGLTDLNVHGNALRDADVRRLQELPKLSHLALLGSPITDEGLETLAALKLSRLELKAAAISDAGLTHLQKMTSLTKVWVLAPKVTATGIADLRKALPNCRIEWDDPAQSTTPKPQ